MNGTKPLRVLRLLDNERAMTLDEAGELRPGTPLERSDLAISRKMANRYEGRGEGATLVRVTGTGYLRVLLEGNKYPTSYSPAFWDCAK